MSKCLLHYNRIERFKMWLTAHSYKWRDMSTVGNGFQLFNIYIPKTKQWCGIYWRFNASEHVTVDSRIDWLVRLFIKSSKMEDQAASELGLQQNPGHCVLPPDPVLPPAYPAAVQLAAEFRAAKRWPHPQRTGYGLYRHFGLLITDEFGDLVTAPYTYPHGVLDALSEAYSVNYSDRREQARGMDYIQRNSRSAACP